MSITNIPATTQLPTPTSLIQQAIEKGVDMQQLKELMDLQERWERKEAKKDFLEALSKFQSLVPVLKKSKTATVNSQKGSFSYKYSDLGSITSAIKSALNECGLSFRWEFEETNDKMKVTCLVSHLAGHTETTSMEAGKDGSGFKNDIQQKGSTHTYLQRYTLIGALGLSTADEDNDGKGSGRSSNTTQKKQEMTREEVIDQWKREVEATRNRVELQALYVRNKKVVDADKDIQAIFRLQETVLKAQEAKAKTTSSPVNAMP